MTHHFLKFKWGERNVIEEVGSRENTPVKKERTTEVRETKKVTESGNTLGSAESQHRIIKKEIQDDEQETVDCAELDFK